MKAIFSAVIALAVFLLTWQGIAEFVLWQRAVPFPTPWDTAQRLFDLIDGSTLSGHSLAVHVRSSLKRWVVGFGIAAVLGIGYGLVAGRFQAVDIATSRIPQTLLLVPGLAWVPVAILLFGVGETATIFMIALSAFAPVAVSVHSGIRNIDSAIIRAARMMGAGPGDLFIRVLLPAALPSILCGLRIGLGTGWRVLVAAEMVVGTGTGLGYSIIQSRWNLDYASSFACIIVICGIGLTCEQLMLRYLENESLKRWTLPGDPQ